MVDLTSSPVSTESARRLAPPPVLLQRPTTWAFAATVLAVCLLHGVTLESFSDGWGGPQAAGQAKPFSTRIIAPPPLATQPAEPKAPAKATPKPQSKPASTTQTPPTWSSNETDSSDSIVASDVARPDIPTDAVETIASTDVAPPLPDVAPTDGSQPISTVVSEQSQQPFAINYRVKSSGFPEGFADFVLDVKEGTYNLRLEANGFGFKRTSSGRLSDLGFVPEVYREKRPFKSELAAHIVRDREQIVFSNNAPTAPIADERIQDELSVIVQLASVLSSTPQLQSIGTQLQYQTVRTGSADNWVFQVMAQELISLPKGETTAIKLVRQPRQEYDTKVELWYAPSMGYQPVRIVLTRSDGGTLSLQSLSAIPPFIGQ